MGGPSGKEHLDKITGNAKKSQGDILNRIAKNRDITDETRKELTAQANEITNIGTSSVEGAEKEFASRIAGIEEKFKQAENPEAGSVFDRRQQVKKFLDTVRKTPGRRQLIGSR